MEELQAERDQLYQAVDKAWMLMLNGEGWAAEEMLRQARELHDPKTPPPRPKYSTKQVLAPAYGTGGSGADGSGER